MSACQLCESLSLKGRILIAKEGINGTLEGTTENTEKYIAAMNAIPEFKDIVYKKSVGDGTSFKKLVVKVREEIVTSEVDVKPWVETGKYISSEELHQWFDENREFYIVDMRNDYEYASGYFEGTIFSGMSHFKDLKKVVPKISHLKGKTVVTVCTGGVRCEKASGFLLQEGFTDVYQLKDGIQTYMETYPNEHFKGKLYVFDGRITIGFNTDSSKHEVVGTCMLCNISCDSYVNCMNHECHLHFICCESCRDRETGMSFCSKKCKEIVTAPSFSMV
jgi:UPF0176 protein